MSDRGQQHSTPDEDPGDGLAFHAGYESVPGGPVAVRLEVSADGRLGDFGLVVGSYVTAAGAGYELGPPAVVLAEGSAQASGFIEFSDLPDAESGSGSISGTVAWDCPGG